ncbi:MAG: diphthamide synthesis protein [Nanoarchaeota archaeon]
MKTIFIPARTRYLLNKSKISEISRKLPNNIAITYSIQYKEMANEIKDILSKSHNIIKIQQVLGCSNPEFPKNTQAVLLIGSGRFHAISLALETSLPIYIYTNGGLESISSSEIDSFRKKKKGSYLKYLSSKNIGILVSTKPGQQKLEKALEFRKKLKNKKSYIFIANNINTSEFENFDIDCWVNTACPRMDMNAGVVNLKDITKN